MLNTLLSYDTSLLMTARTLLSPEYAVFVQILGELIVLWCMIFLVGLWLYGVFQKKNEYKLVALRIFFTIILVFIFYAIINFGIPKWRPSPQEIVGIIDPLINHPIDNSFPSGHALFSGAFLFGIFRYFYNTRILSITGIIALITVVSRVLGGVHYPGDILGGVIIGLLGGYLVTKLTTSELMEKTLYPLIIQILAWIKL